MRKKFFVSDMNVDRGDPVQLHLVYKQVRERRKEEGKEEKRREQIREQIREEKGADDSVFLSAFRREHVTISDTT